MPVKSVVEHMRSVAFDGQMETQVRRVDEHLLAQRTLILNNTNEQCCVLQTKLKDKFDNVLEHIRGLRQSKKWHFHIMESTLKKFQRFVDEKYNNDYRNKIWSHFNEIQNKVNDAYDALTTKRLQLVHLVTQAQEEFLILKTNTQESVSKSTDDPSIQHNWAALKSQIAWDVGQIVNDNQTSGHLDAIVKAIEGYAKKFNKHGMFGTQIVAGWLNGIFDKEPVKGLVATYIGSSLRNNVVAVEKLKFIVTAWIKTMAGHVTTSPTFNETVEDHLRNIQKFFSEFAKKVDPDKPGEMVEYVHLQFQQTLRGRPLPNSQTELEPAVKAILTAVHCAALQVGEELKSFTSDTISKYDLGIKLKAAIAEVDKIKQQIDSKKASEYNNGVGKKIDDALLTVQSKIKSLDRYLVNESGDESIRKGIGDIKTDVLDKLDKLQNVKDETNSIESRKTKADELMNSLKNEIQNKLIEFELNLTSADDALTKTIDSVYSAAVKARGYQAHRTTTQQNASRNHRIRLQKVTDEVQKLLPKDTNPT
ncbi:hypothetical protein, conserved [Babesia ovata]|uniref:Uncharacterized protein n=1 Tax=Babesia ovata TaxID=189622 RepID=A0A2H6KK91_9APIC|nr:uncharacterized protein BOVATA_048920 [Babesia ovata]GBE63399.1 hypothetical protein, conserved [Babesia ovata]